MLLVFGSFKLDTATLPPVSAVRVDPPVSERRPVLVHVKLDGTERAAVEQWAERLGVPVTEQMRPLYHGDPQPREIAAVAAVDGYRVIVYTRAAAQAPATAGGRAVVRALAGALGFAAVAHSPVLSATLLPALGAFVAAEAAYVIASVRRKKVRT